MNGFFDKLYSNETFPIILIISICVLILLFCIVLFLAFKDMNKRKKKNTPKLEPTKKERIEIVNDEEEVKELDEVDKYNFEDFSFDDDFNDEDLISKVSSSDIRRVVDEENIRPVSSNNKVIKSEDIIDK